MVTGSPPLDKNKERLSRVLRKSESDDVFNRFSPAAKRVLRLAEQECRNLNHYYVGAEHLLLALCEEPDQATAAYLAEHRLSKDRLRAALRRSLGTGEDRWGGGYLAPPGV